MTMRTRKGRLTRDELVERLLKQDELIMKFRKSLPEATKLEVWANWLDVYTPDDMGTDLQDQLRAWAVGIREFRSMT